MKHQTCRKVAAAGAMLTALAAVRAQAEGDLVTVVSNFQPIEETTFTRDSDEWADRCIPDPGAEGTTYRILRFDFNSRNVGDEAIVAGQRPPALPCSGCPCGDQEIRGNYEWSPTHCHWHLKDFNTYSLVRPSSAQERTGNKQAFCLMDYNKWSSNAGPSTPRYKCADQGISVGWEDVYSYSLPCQFLILDNVSTGQTLPDGDYRLVATTNSAPTVTEANIHNNSVAIPLRKAGQTITPIGGAFQPRERISTPGTAALSPALVSWGPNRLDAFWVDESGTLKHVYKAPTSNGAWSATAELGAPTGVSLSVDSVDAASWAPQRIDVIARGADGKLWRIFYAGGAWSGWDNPAGAAGLAPAGRPAINSFAPDRLDLVWGDASGALRHVAWLGERWGSIDDLGEPSSGDLTPSPRIVSWERNRLDVVARGSDNRLWHKYWTPSGFSGWGNPGGVASVGARPEVVSWGPKRLDVFWPSSRTNAQQHISFSGSTWSAVDSLRPPFLVNVQAAASAVAWGPNRLDLFVRSSGSRLWHLSWNGARWSWDSAYSQTDLHPSAVPAVASWAANQVTALVGMRDGDLAANSWL